MRVPVVTLVAMGLAVGIFVWFNHANNQKSIEIQAFSEVAEAVTQSEIKINYTEQVSIDMPINEERAYDSPYNFEELHSINIDIVAWMSIPETSVDYPIVFNGSEDYIHKDLNGEYSFSGTPFIDKAASNPMKDTVNIIYGHNMKDGSMFSVIDDYNEPNFFQEHNTIKIYLENEELTLQPVVTITGKADAAVRGLSDVNSLLEFAKGKTIAAGEMPETVDSLYVFVTCNYSGQDFRTYLICSN